jgi:putative oxidoreductase
MWRRVHEESRATDLGLLALRATMGGLMAGHGAQKLFGLFGGYGLAGTGGWLESMGMKPGKAYAAMAGASEFGSGLLTAVGFLNPLGPIAMFGPMMTAWGTAHAGKPIWNTAGGAELPLAYMASATAIGLSGPGRYSLDHYLDIKVPRMITALAGVGVVAGFAASMLLREAPAAPQAAEEPQPIEEPAQPQDETESPLQEREAGA